jgi:hypothetical protein
MFFVAGAVLTVAACGGAKPPVETPAGKFENCLRLHEATPLEPDDLSIKLYAPGIGMIGDGSLRLVEQGIRL